MAKKTALRLAVTTLLAFVSSWVLMTTLAAARPDAFGPLPALAQRVRPEGVWQAVYVRLPDFPKENQYVSKETGKVEPDNTLVGRFIRYHLYVAGRSPSYRFDWKLTLADYLGLGLNGAFDETSYPSRGTLRTNPADGDRAAIKRLDRAQREALVQTLVTIFTSQAVSAAPLAPAIPHTNLTPANSLALQAKGQR